MAYKEEKILLPASLEHLKENDWASIRDQENELGFFFVLPGSEWQPITAANLHAPAGTVIEPQEVLRGQNFRSTRAR